MTGAGAHIRLTVAQAVVRWLMSQFTLIDGVETRICRGGFGIFGHGNVPCLGEALYPALDEMPLYRGQNDQSMGFAAAAYAKHRLRRRFMFCIDSTGPGTANLLTSAALAHASRLPMLMRCGDTFLTLLADPVLQKFKHFGNPTVGVKDAFKAVSRNWDRITHPAQILQLLHTTLATKLEAADRGPSFIGLPQDLQGWAFDYPVAFFAKRVHRIRRKSPDMAAVDEAVALLKIAKRPVKVAGGGVQYSGAGAELTTLAEAHGIPVLETIAGRANLLADHPLNIGPFGVKGSDSANTIVGAADVVLAVGTRLQDFTTWFWTVFAKGARLIGLNVARHDAAKYQSLAVVGDAKLGLLALGAALKGHCAPSDWVARARALGANAETVAIPAELAGAFQRAKQVTKTSVIVMQVDPYEGWTTQGHAWWAIGTAQVSESAGVLDRHAEVEAGSAAQRQGV